MTKKRVQDHLIFKISLLSISIFLMMAPSISPALPLMYHAFPGVGRAEVETLATIPNIGVVLGLLISPFLIRLIGQKVTILLGLVVTLIAGTFPMYCNIYLPILISRFLIGAGIGLFNSLAVSLIPQFYNSDEEEMATMIGFQSVMSGVGAAIASFLISWLVTISWHAAFAIYFLVIPVLILFTLFVPLPRAKKATSQHTTKGRQHINGKVILIAILMLLIFMFYMPASFKMPALVVEQHLGTVSQLSILTGILNLVSIPMGAAFGFFFKHLHDKVFPLGALIIALGFLTASTAANFAILAFGNLLLGIGFGLLVPYMYNWLDWSAPQNSVNLATTIVLVLVNVGCAISPMILNAFTSTAKAALLFSTAFFVLLAVYAIYHYISVHRVQEPHKESNN